ncbi:MAG: hypothetical protein IJ224_07105 [Lachnospiraceae bacterium]|nr:hypothetical protein [Lachnospiraceae bacterium]
MIILLALIYENEIVFKGAADGLMLWFNNVIPLLLPFMLISALIVRKINRLPQEKQKNYAVLITLFTGIFCGYPLGAKNSADFVKCNAYSKETGNILCPLCNNCSPMFLSGYIVANVLNKSISFFNAIFLIYTPYIFYILIAFSLNHFFKTTKAQEPEKNPDINNSKSNDDIILSTIIQITYVGFYIIICSIISEMIMSFDISLLYNKLCKTFSLTYNTHALSLIEIIKTVLSGITEITKGTLIASTSLLFSPRQKTALVLALSSFGGISAILQTKNVIKDSGLSIKKYIITKTICAFTTYGLSLMLL